MQHIENIIYTALNQSDNNDLRAQAEREIYHLTNNNPTDLFLTLATIVADDNKSTVIRQSVATVFKRLLALKVLCPPSRTIRTSCTGT